MIKINNKTILFAPLDWGLGHATRCIPLIKTLKNAGYDIIVAVCEKQKILLSQEFNDIRFIDLNGYNIKYTKNKWLFILKICSQIPKILRSIQQENKWLDALIEKENIALVISDNRYGLYSSKIPCVFIAHQLTIKAPYTWIENILQKINYQYINHFSQCWIPDIEGEKNIAGILSHPKKMPSIATHYIGILSRFSNTETSNKYDVCVLLSGPEPQRTSLENILLKQLSSIKNKKILFVRGLPQITEKLEVEGLEIANHLQGNALQEAICSSEFIVARSGYTTVMELLTLRKKSILIPTPGQTEQEYLATHLQQQRRCLSFNQNELDIVHSLEAAKNFNYQLSDNVSYEDDKVLLLVENLLK